MQNSISTAWRTRCADLGLDPHEVKAVAKRYDMYKRYTDEQGGDTLPLDRWYKWYRVEKLSEGHAMLTPPEQDCSVQAGTERTGPVISEQDFLQLLVLYRQNS